MIVSNTSPIVNLGCVGELPLLKQLCGVIYIPREVQSEILKLAQEEKQFRGLHLPGFIQVVEIKDRTLYQKLLLKLDRGEAASIVLAIELRCEKLLIDEKLGRKEAKNLGIKVQGILGILIEAKRKKLISKIKPILKKLEFEAGFWLEEDFLKEYLQQTQE